MQITVFLFLTSMQVSAKGYSQITLAETNMPLAKVFQKIEKQSGYLFWYNDALLQRARKVDINVTNATLQQVLDICFKDQPLTYSIIETVVVVKKIDEASAPPNAGPPPVDIKGKVTDDAGLPIARATVTVKGTTHSTATNDLGE